MVQCSTFICYPRAVFLPPNMGGGQVSFMEESAEHYSCVRLQPKPMRLFRPHCSDKFSLMLFKILRKASENGGLLALPPD